MKIDGGVSNTAVGIVVAICAAPAATLNIWPRVAQMHLEGISGSQIGIILLVSVSALGMAAIPFAMKKAENWGFWSVCLTFGVGLAILNYAMAVGAIGKVRDHEADGNRKLQAQYQALNAQLTDALRSRTLLPPYRETTEQMVETGKAAVALAERARLEECKIVGDYCRARIAQLASRQAELGTLAADFSTTRRAYDLDRAVAELRERTSRQTNPTSVDRQASRLAGLVTVFINLGPDAAERVADGLISVLAIAAEAIGLGLPRILVTALSGVSSPLLPFKVSGTVPPAALNGHSSPAPRPAVPAAPRIPTIPATLPKSLPRKIPKTLN